MEGGGVLGETSSGRIGSSSSSIWRSTGLDVFSTSSREEDDEEALKFAALERLPSYLRVRRGILNEDEGGAIIENRLLERLVNIADEDNEKLLSKLKERIDRAGLDLPTIEVRFEHLNVEAEAYVGRRALPTLLNFCVNMIEGFGNYLHILPSRKQPHPILQDVSGIIRPGRMTLLLGPPSSGKTTLLQALAGRLSSDLKFSGRVTYNGYEMNEFVPQRTAAYISQEDLHIGEMTVRETLAFSAKCQGVGPRYDMLVELLRREEQANIKPDPEADVYRKEAASEEQQANIVIDYVLKVITDKNNS